MSPGLRWELDCPGELLRAVNVSTIAQTRSFGRQAALEKADGVGNGTDRRLSVACGDDDAKTPQLRAPETDLRRDQGSSRRTGWAAAPNQPRPESTLAIA